jgi:hypothetical protein
MKENSIALDDRMQQLQAAVSTQSLALERMSHQIQRLEQALVELTLREAAASHLWNARERMQRQEATVSPLWNAIDRMQRFR